MDTSTAFGESGMSDALSAERPIIKLVEVSIPTSASGDKTLGTRLCQYKRNCNKSPYTGDVQRAKFRHVVVSKKMKRTFIQILFATILFTFIIIIIIIVTIIIIIKCGLLMCLNSPH